MKKINKLLLCLSLFASLSLAGCATASKPKPVSTVSPAELKCRSACQLMAKCSMRAGRAYSEHDLLICGRECLATHPELRAVVSECSIKVLSKRCDMKMMNDCVKARLRPLQKQ